jgi:hypothetical protein
MAASAGAVLQSPTLGERPEWFHIILRDVVGHVETSEQEQPNSQRTRRDARAQFIARAKFGCAYVRLCEIADQLMGFLMDRSGISDPR